MRVRLIDDDEPPIRVEIGESTFWVRRISASKRREVEARHRRSLRQMDSLGRTSPEAIARFLQAVEDDLLDSLLIRWEGLDGNSECNRENKLRLPEQVKQILRGMAENPSLAEAEEAEAKNFGSPSAS